MCRGGEKRRVLQGGRGNNKGMMKDQNSGSFSSWNLLFDKNDGLSLLLMLPDLCLVEQKPANIKKVSQAGIFNQNYLQRKRGVKII